MTLSEHRGTTFIEKAWNFLSELTGNDIGPIRGSPNLSLDNEDEQEEVMIGRSKEERATKEVCVKTPEPSRSFYSQDNNGSDRPGFHCSMCTDWIGPRRGMSYPIFLMVPRGSSDGKQRDRSLIGTISFINTHHDPNHDYLKACRNMQYVSSPQPLRLCSNGRCSLARALH